jgi:hypothetical protein
MIATPIQNPDLRGKTAIFGLGICQAETLPAVEVISVITVLREEGKRDDHRAAPISTSALAKL